MYDRKSSAVVVSYNSAAWLRRCLRKLLSDAHGHPEVIVVDNASDDDSGTLVAQEFPTVMTIKNPINLGFAGGANVGLGASEAEVVVILNPDVEVSASSLNTLVETLLARPDTAIAGAKLLYPDGRTIQHAGGMLSYPLAFGNHRGYGEEDQGQYDEVCEVEYVTGAVFAIRKSILDEIGYFDEGFFPAYFEEVDLCLRARRAGYKVLYVPRAVAIHQESATIGKDTPQSYQFFHRNRLRFVLKHYSDDQLWQDFLLAELLHLRQLTTDVELAALRTAYAENLSVLQGTSDFFANPDAVARLQRTLKRVETLRVLSGRAEGMLALSQEHAGVTRELLEWLDARREIVEKPFVSPSPVVGRAIVGVRRFWNWMSTKWYVRSMVQQQNEFNASLVELLRHLERDVQAVEASIVERARRGLQHEEDCTRLEARLQRLEAQMTDVKRQLTELADRNQRLL